MVTRSKTPILNAITEQTQEHAIRWLWIYNNERPNTAIGQITLKQRLMQLAHELSTFSYG